MIKVICFFVILAIYIAWLLIKMELVNGAKAGKRKLYGVQFSRCGRLRRVQLWEPKRADDKSHLLFVCFNKFIVYTAWLLIKMELVNGAKAE